MRAIERKGGGRRGFLNKERVRYIYTVISARRGLYFTYIYPHAVGKMGLLSGVEGPGEWSGKNIY